jgi:septum formation protein
LLAQIGIVPARIAPADIDETPRRDELPRPYVERLARAKAEAAADSVLHVLAADTVVAAGRRILGKPANEAVAADCLRLLSGRRHRVLTSVALRSPDGRLRARTCVSVVGFARLTEAQLAAYLATGEYADKAGGYAIQGHAASFVRFISGSYSNVVGLPLFETAQLLRGAGWTIP